MEQIEAQEFIKQMLHEIENGVDIESRKIDGPIEIEFSVDRVEGKGAGAKFYVLTGNLKSEQKNATTVKFKVFPKKSERQKREEENEVYGAVQTNKKNQKDWRIGV